MPAHFVHPLSCMQEQPKIRSVPFSLGIEVNFSLPAKDFPLGPRARDSARLSLEPVQNLTTACRQAAARTRPVSAHKSPSELPSAHLWFWARRQSRSGLNQCRPRLPARMRAFIPFDAIKSSTLSPRTFRPLVSVSGQRTSATVTIRSRLVASS